MTYPKYRRSRFNYRLHAWRMKCIDDWEIWRSIPIAFTAVYSEADAADFYQMRGRMYARRAR